MSHPIHVTSILLAGDLFAVSGFESSGHISGPGFRIKTHEEKLSTEVFEITMINCGQSSIINYYSVLMVRYT